MLATRPHRINLWDTATGAIAQQIALPSGLPLSFDVSPNGQRLVAMLDDGHAGLKLSVSRELPAKEPGPMPPAAVRPR